MSEIEKTRLDLLRQEALSLPPAPGVYLMKDHRERIIYVGKAKLLPRRVSSYFQKTCSSVRVGLMAVQVKSFDFVVTATEKEALLLENSLIKKYRPKYNVILRDDKTYPSLRLRLDQDFPRLEMVRRPIKDGSVVFGPFPSSGAMWETVRLAHRLFPLRQCRRPEVKKIDRPCLNYQMGLCLGPCRPEVTPEEYRVLTDQVRLFFRGRHQELIKSLTTEMKAAADRYEFEEAARLRDRLHKVRKTLERQVVAQIDEKDCDVLGFSRNQGLLQGAVLSLRGGVLSGCQPLELSGDQAGEAADHLSGLLGQYYGAGHFVPDEILLPAALPDEEREFLEEWLGDLKGRTVRILAPQRGDKVRLLEMAKENARVSLEERFNRINRSQGVMVEIQARLGLEKIPRRLECFDLAHLQGTDAAAGLVVMETGEWKKDHYRRFKIKAARGGDDYAGMREVVARRFAHEDWPWPDLLLLDGGKGQLASAQAAFEDLGIKPPPLAAIAKVREEGGIDRVFVPGRKNPVDLKAGSAGLLMLARLRDEAHRYVGAYHHKLRSKTFLSSPLLNVPGLGPARRKRLLAAFGSLENIRSASDQEILKVLPLGAETLTALKASFTLPSASPLEAALLPEALPADSRQNPNNTERTNL